MKLYIKNMICIRCKMKVKEELNKLGLHYVNLTLGEVEIMEKITENQRRKLKKALQISGLELMDDKRSVLVEKIKLAVIEMIHYADELPKINISYYLSEKLKCDYNYLSNLFSEVTGASIEHYIITHKVEKIKELIIYDELNLSEIANKLHYSSVAHLSRQFKTITGLTPSFFKSMKHKMRNELDKL